MATKTNTSAPYAAPATSWWIPIRLESLRTRLALLAALLLCLIQLVLSVIFYTFTSSWLVNQVDQSLMTTGTQFVASVDEDDLLEGDDLDFNQNNAVTNSFLRDRQFFVRVMDRQTGKILGESASYNDTMTTGALSGDESFETVGALRIYTTPITANSRYVLQVGQSLQQVIDTQDQMLRLLVIMLLATAILAGASGWFLAHRALIPVSAITRTAQEIGEKDLSRRIANNLPDDELGRLARTFNHMLDRIESAFQRQRQFTADAAHELRTPLSIMQTGLEVVLAQPRKIQDYHAALGNMQEEVLRLSQLTNHLLMLARADAHTLTIERHAVDLSLLLNTVAEQVAIAAEQKQITLQADIPPQIIVQADEDRLIRLALNLMENAVKYTPEDGTVAIKLTPSDQQVCFSVTDTGVGIAPEHLPHIFDRFYRADRARNRQQGGVGLGLAIARQIAQLHGGDISVSSQPGTGSTFTVILPTS